MLRRLLKDDPNFIDCPYRDPKNPKNQCGGGHLHEGGGTFIICSKCERPYCAKHKIAWHQDETCEDYDNRTVSGYRSSLARERESFEEHQRRMTELDENLALRLTLEDRQLAVQQSNNPEIQRS